jgi:hypothetical protein
MQILAKIGTPGKYCPSSGRLDYICRQENMMAKRNWFDIAYLREGDPLQQAVYEAIHGSGIMEKLAAYTPVPAGSYPIGVYLPGSDIDIICCFNDRDMFYHELALYIQAFNKHSMTIKTIREMPGVIGRFEYGGFEFEVFGQALNVERQYAFRHMLVEHRLLQERGDGFRREVIALKRKGLSTEEAFASLLGIEGDPYEGLLKAEAGQGP